MYSNEKDVLDVVSRILFIAAATTFFDALQTILGGVLRGTANQHR
jgi:Na+-driven multidrug efflux pump